ncbi:hypothetical protein [Microcoleus sp. EPA2]|uniref:hypothetical protein n=1 Tax=Microcoleus sp. EPA2 TaxID=2841654 RepID=UPI00312B4621
MQLRPYPLVLLTASLLLGLTGQQESAFSFSLGGDTSSKTISYKDPIKAEGKITVKQVKLLDPPAQSSDFIKNLKTLFQGWEFNTVQIDGRFEVLENNPYYTPEANFPDEATHVGAKFQLNYLYQIAENGVSSSFHNNINNLHWIQRVTNYEFFNDRKGEPNNFIDVPSFQGNPFYDLQFPGMLQPGVFKDYPFRNNVSIGHTFDAELYLVEKTADNKVSIYNGVSWGWKSTINRPKTSKKFSDSLASGFEVDRFNLPNLTPGSKYIAWTNNDLPSNRCNPNTFLSTHNNSGFRLGFDDNSSSVGNGFASALTGTVGSSGNINLDVRAAGGGARGQDTGNYELFVDVYDPQDSPDFSSASSGGGGFGKEKRGLTQQNPILPNSIQNGWQVFNKVPGCRWFDPPTTYGFEFQSLEDTLFTEILDFPVGDDQEFTVAVGDSILGNFSPGDKLDFISLLGYPVDNFRITGIDSLFGETAETAFPIQLAFQEREGSFKMRQIPKPIDAEAVPEPGSILATKGMLLWFAGMRHILRKKRQAG